MTVGFPFLLLSFGILAVVCGFAVGCLLLGRGLSLREVLLASGFFGTFVLALAYTLCLAAYFPMQDWDVPRAVLGGMVIIGLGLLFGSAAGHRLGTLFVNSANPQN